MSRTFPAVSAFLLALAACVWATAALSRGPIERDLTGRSLEVLAGIEGFRPEFCQVHYSGRDGRVSGEVPSGEVKAEAERQLERLYGARLIKSEFIVRPYDTPWILVESDGGSGGQSLVRVDGLLGYESERAAFADGLEGALGGGQVVDLKIEVRSKVNPAPWLGAVGEVAGDLVLQAKGARAQLRDGEFSLQGELPDAAAKETLAELAERQLGGAGVTVNLALRVAPPAEPSRFQLFPPQGREITVAGRLADLESAGRLLALLRGHSGTKVVKDQIVVAENTTAAPWLEGLTLLLPSVLSEVTDAGIVVEGAVLRLEGQVPEEMFAAIGEVAAQNFPAADFEVQNQLSLLTPPEEARVSLVIFPGDPVRLKGLLGSAALKESVVAATKLALAGGELLTDDLVVGSNVLQAGWIEALVSLIPPYIKQVKRGGLTINGDTLVVSSVIDSDSERDAIWAMTEQFFPDDAYRRILEFQFPEDLEKFDEPEGSGGGVAAEGKKPGEQE